MKQKKFFGIFVLLCLGLSIFFFRSAFDYKKFEILYNSGAYMQAQELLERKEELSAVQLHNLGNTLYKQAGTEENTKEFLEKALVSYAGSLGKQEHPDTRWNYELVKKLLSDTKNDSQTEEEKQQEEQKQDQKSQEETGSGSQEQMGSGSTASGSSSGQKEQTSENGEQQASSSVLQNARAQQYKLEQDATIEALSEEEKQQLDATISALKEEQVYNQQFFGKKQQEKNDFQKAFESLMGGSEEKDW